MKKFFFCFFLISQISFSQCWIKVEIGDNHTLAIKSDGTLWTWGINNYGQLGNGNNTNQNIPIQVGNATDWQSVSCGNSFTIAKKVNG